MSISTKGATPLDGLCVGTGGVPFCPNDEDSAFATYERNGRSCAVICEMCDGEPYLKFCPDWQIPAGARSRDAWNRFAFESDDDRMLELHVDFEDGEVRFFHSLGSIDDLDVVARAIDEGVNFVTSIYPSVVDCVRAQLKSACRVR